MGLLTFKIFNRKYHKFQETISITFLSLLSDQKLQKKKKKNIEN